MPDQFETSVLVDFIKNNYANHTVSEIKLAFNMAVQGGLLDVDANAYENFSCQYFGKVFVAYRKWAAQEHNQKIRENEAKETQQDVKKNETVDWSVEWIKLVKQAKNGTIRKEFIPIDLYNWLDKNGKVEYSAKDKWEVLYECLWQYHAEMKAAILMNEQRGILIPGDIKRIIEMIECYVIDQDAVVIDNNPWKRDKAIMSIVTNMSKQEIVRQLAISESLNETE